MARQRNIEVTVNGALPINGYKAAIQRVNEYEERIAAGESLTKIDPVAGDPAVKQVVTSISAYQSYVFDLSEFDPVLGTYVLDLVEIRPSET